MIGRNSAIVSVTPAESAPGHQLRPGPAPIPVARGAAPTVPVHSGLDGVMHNGVGAQEDIHRWLIIGRSHHSPL